MKCGETVYDKELFEYFPCSHNSKFNIVHGTPGLNETLSIKRNVCGVHLRSIKILCKKMKLKYKVTKL